MNLNFPENSVKSYWNNFLKVIFLLRRYIRCLLLGHSYLWYVTSFFIIKLFRFDLRNFIQVCQAVTVQPPNARQKLDTSSSIPHWSAGNYHECWVKASLQSFTDNDEGSVWWKILENDEKQHTRNINNHYTVWKKNCFICHKCNFSVLKNECLVSRPSQARWIRSITVSEVLQILELLLN